ncbi:MAG: ferrous iron transport protein A [Clostridiales bacterium]|nr:ferrous iron transport protein A [Clostridiales bacterium]
MSLSKVNVGTSVILHQINYGLNLKKKLQDMGLTPGVEFSVVSKTNSGPIIIEVRGSRLALGRGIAEKIDVEIVS